MSEYDAMRLDGIRAMKELRENDQRLRTPTPAWQGLSLSRSSPLALEAGRMSQWLFRDQTSPFKMGFTTSIVDATPVIDRVMLSQHKDVSSVTLHLKLDHYIIEYIFYAACMELMHDA